MPRLRRSPLRPNHGVRPVSRHLPPALRQVARELAPRWEAARESARAERRGGARRRARGAGRRQKLVFTDRLLVTLVYLRLGVPHAAVAELYGVDRSTVSGGIREVRALLAARGFAVPDRPGLRIRTLEDLFAYAESENITVCMDGTEVQAGRPQAGRPGRKAFVSGKKKQNTIKTTTFSDHQGRALFSGVMRPGRMHDQTAVRTEGIAELFHQHPDVKAEVDEGYRGYPNFTPGRYRRPFAAPTASPTEVELVVSCCCQAGLMVSPVSARQPSMRWLR
ncbi:transposase family protein, partial [Streptomyces sp. NPDC049915]|uniref:transposase family protein n=1 Tax=Streptomyces sp. NPDC049915 TaxID=3155510 RepID=UPI003443C10D